MERNKNYDAGAWKMPTMELNNKHQRIANIGGTLVLLIIMLIIASTLCSCGLTIGPKESPYLKLPDGLSFNIGVNNIDHVLDRKGLNIQAKDNKSTEKY